MKRVKLFQVIISLAIISGCRPGNLIAPTQTIVNKASPTDTMKSIFQTPTLKPLSTIKTPTVTPRPSATPQPTPSLGFESHCLTEQSEDGLSTIPLSWAVVLIRQHELSLLDLETMKEQVIGHTDSSVYISPNNRQIVFVNQELVAGKQSLVIGEFEWIDKISIQMPEDWIAPIGWINNQQIVIMLEDGQNSTDNPKQPSLLAINQDTLEYVSLRTDLPEIYRHPFAFMWTGWNSVVYSPDLSQAWYIAGSSLGPEYFVQWDLVRQLQIAVFPLGGDFHAFPRWSPDGKTVAIAVDWHSGKAWPAYEIYNIDQSGDVSQMTNLDLAPPIYISDLSWSPDGKLIAFWYSQPDKFDGTGDQKLAVLDISRGTVTDYCIKGESNAMTAEPRNVPAPIWSPDSRYLLVESKENAHTLNEKTRIVIVDLQQKTADILSENSELVGLLIK